MSAWVADTAISPKNQELESGGCTAFIGLPDGSYGGNPLGFIVYTDEGTFIKAVILL